MNTENVENVCGLPQCVNVQHWKAKPRVAPFRLMYSDGRWVLAHSATGAEVSRVEAFSLLSLDGVIHLARATPGRETIVFCGKADLASSLAVIAPVTCAACL